MKKLLILLLFSLVSFSSCDDVFKTHPYDVNFNHPHHINAQQIIRIETDFANSDTLRVAFISDTHGWMTHTKQELDMLNERQDVDFVIHCGDLTDTGMRYEFERARDMLSRLRYPYVALIGNHDFLGTGEEAYEVIFGEKNFSFIAGGVKFVCLDTSALEYDYMAMVPDLDYMEYEATRDSSRFDRTVVVMHVPPSSEEFNKNLRKTFRYYLSLFPNLQFCVFGHNHHTYEEEMYNDGLMFYGVGSAEKHQCRLFTITRNDYEVETLYY